MPNMPKLCVSAIICIWVEGIDGKYHKSCSGMQFVVHGRSIASTLLITSRWVAQARVTKLNTTLGKRCKLGIGGWKIYTSINYMHPKRVIMNSKIEQWTGHHFYYHFTVLWNVHVIERLYKSEVLDELVIIEIKLFTGNMILE